MHTAKNAYTGYNWSFFHVQFVWICALDRYRNPQLPHLENHKWLEVSLEIPPRGRFIRPSVENGDD